MNSRLQNINKKYSGNLVSPNGEYNKRGRAYLAEVDKTWKNVYAKTLIDYFVKDPINNGKDWVKNALRMDMYEPPKR